jgi:hypothetical protein
MRFALIAGGLLAIEAVTALHSTPVHLPGLAHIQHQISHRDALTYSNTPDRSQQIFQFDSTRPVSSDIVQGIFTQRLDHFANSTDATFNQRFWYSLRHYKPQSGKPTPIFLLDSGETDAANRLPYLDHGILDILANATNGIGIVLEHRCYGGSIPKRSDLGPGRYWGVDELQWLTTAQALEDNAQFVQHFTIAGLDKDEMDKLRAPNAPVISYGGSYPGGKSAFLRVLYPDLFFGSLASSAVVSAINHFPQYFYPIADGTHEDCVSALESSIQYIDSILTQHPQDTDATNELLAMFGLQDLDDLRDFANVLSSPLGSFQQLNWDPSVSTTTFAKFCTALVGHTSGPKLPPRYKSHDQGNDVASGHQVLAPAAVHTYGQYIKEHFVEPCVSSNSTVQECFGSSDLSYIQRATQLNDSNGIAWTFQVCTEWGYFMTAPTSEAPGPKLISSLIDLNYTTNVCRNGFLPGKQFKMPSMPRNDLVNRYGSFDIAADRLAFIDGQYDPWRPATVHSQEFGSKRRKDTLNRPFKLIATCWHHCDENGNKTYEPSRIRSIHAQEVEFVQHWLKQF